MTIGVLVMAHGTPATPEEIEPFYTRIRRGRPPTPEQLADLRRRYDAIGGTSPLAARTAAQVAGVRARLDAVRPGDFVVRYGAKHTDPSIEDAVADLVTDGVDRVVGLVLAPHRSQMGSGEYLDRAAAALERMAPDVPFVPVRQWYDTPGFAELVAGRVLAALASLPPRSDDRAGGDRVVVFTAHSLPERVVAAGDPYPEQVAESARAVAEQAGLHEAGPRAGGLRWQVAWQSAGRTPDPWLGPDVLDVIRGLPAEGAGAVVVCPIGFVADHLEVLFDLDVEARAVAESVGIAFARTASLNDDAGFLDLLAEVVVRAADADAHPPGGSPGVGHRPRRRPTVAVVGGGVAGLAAAWELTGGTAGPGPGSPEVVVLEAAAVLGGKVRAERFGDRPVDLGPDGFLGRRPEAAALCREVGLGDDLRPVGASGAAVWAGGRRRTLPAGQVMGVPTRFLPVARSGILGLWGNLRLLRDVVAPRPDLRGPLGDRAVGPLVANKLGRRVVQRLVDPLIGGIYAGGVDDVSAAAAFPLLLSVPERGSLMRSLRRAQARASKAAQTAQATQAAGDGGPARDGEAGTAQPPAFWSLAGGVGSLADRLAEVVAGRGAAVRTGCPVQRLDRGPAGEPAWLLQTAGGPVPADAVVLAVPAAPAADLLAPHDADAAALLRGIDYASVALVTLAYPADAVPGGLVGTGLLVPRGSPLPPSVAIPPAPPAPPGTPGAGDGTGAGTGDGDGTADRTMLVTACTYLSTKWPHLARPGEFLLRASVGRFGDDRFAAMDDERLVARVAAEVQALLGLAAAPTAWRVARWPDGLPQYRVHHLLRVTGIEAAAKRLPALAVAGAAYRGVGVPACIGSGRAAAATVLGALGVRPERAAGTP
ncbi:MAG TPA: ferrochelatase [Acidimicrobiales bacterium]|nr:ferrochelatase [Acidimicrobiales bacterium]